MIGRRNFERAHRALHALWTAAVGTPGYDKSLWKELDSAIYQLATDGPGYPELLSGQQTRDEFERRAIHEVMAETEGRRKR